MQKRLNVTIIIIYFNILFIYTSSPLAKLDSCPLEIWTYFTISILIIIDLSSWWKGRLQIEAVAWKAQQTVLDWCKLQVRCIIYFSTFFHQFGRLSCYNYVLMEENTFVILCSSCCDCRLQNKQNLLQNNSWSSNFPSDLYLTATI